MPLAPPSVATVAPVTREAEAAATANWRANIAALSETQPSVVERLADHSVDVTWLYARDGALTAQDRTGAWWAGCSVPAAAAKAMLKSFTGSGAAACFLRPPSAAGIRAALGKLGDNQAILAIVPDLDAARVIAQCDDFSADIRLHRLWLVIGDDWESQLNVLLRENEGLPTPTQFVRLTDGNEDLAEAMIPAAQRVLNEITQSRASAIGALLESPISEGATHACVVAPSHFRLWDDAGHALKQLAAELGWPHVDPDEPATASPLAMARAAAGCAAVITPNTARTDLPSVIPLSMPWITWLTCPRIPAPADAAPHDLLLVADPAWREKAITAGWLPSRVHVATWPDAPRAALQGKGPLLLCVDLPSLDAPKEVVEMSSHRLLWDAIAEELISDPFALGNSIVSYLHARMKRLAIVPDAIDPRRFIDGLIAPAYARGLAELLRRNGLPLRLAGRGWDQVESLKTFATGPVTTREAFDEAVTNCAAVVHVWPTGCAHPIDHVGRPVVRATQGRASFLRDASAAVAGRLPASTMAASPLTAERLVQVVRPRA